MNIAGVDLAWNITNNRTAVALGRLRDKSIELEDVACDFNSMHSVLRTLNGRTSVNGVAIDAPLIIKNEKGQRECEKLLGQVYGPKKASCHSTNLTQYPKADSVRLASHLMEEGFRHLGVEEGKWQLECYPHPAIIEIFGLDERLTYKKGQVRQRKEGQCELALRLRELRKSHVLRLVIPNKLINPFKNDYILSLKGAALDKNEDTLDSVVCLYIAGLYAVGVSSRVFGDKTNGYIYVPTKKCV
jgi:predicted RNase H-like nuclease